MPGSDRITIMNSLAPSLLLSMPQLVDPNFARTVVLLCKHGDEGAFGLVMNRPLQTTGRVVVNLGPLGEEPGEPEETVSTDRVRVVWIGGPVEPHRSWMLVAGDPDKDGTTGMRITEDLYLSTSPDLLRRMLEPKPPPTARLVIGYSGWGRGQLETELEASAWLMSDVDRDLLFTTPPECMWETAIRRLGADPATLQMSRGVH
jgi:putative transcriptional regulator